MAVLTLMRGAKPKLFKIYIFRFLYLSCRKVDNCRLLFGKGLDLRLDRD